MEMCSLHCTDHLRSLVRLCMRRQRVRIEGFVVGHCSSTLTSMFEGPNGIVSKIHSREEFALNIVGQYVCITTDKVGCTPLTRSPYLQACRSVSLAIGDSSLYDFMLCRRRVVSFRL